MSAVTPSRLQYMPIVETMAPAGDDIVNDLRCRILEYRARAAETLKDCSDDTGPILLQIDRLATRYAFASVSAEQLRQIWSNLFMLGQVANSFEAMHGRG